MSVPPLSAVPQPEDKTSGSTAEQQRLEESRLRQRHWKRWGPYLSERAWGTVREDYSPGGTAWDDFPHEQARSRAYRWNEDGLAGISDRHQRLCFALALWNGKDPILKERLFGLTGQEGNHGEDVKELYFYLDSTPTHSFMRYLYKYPQAAYPYAELVERNRSAGRGGQEVELLDTGVFNENRYFDVAVDYAKADVEDILVRISVTNRGPEFATVDLLPTLWFRNTWSWDQSKERPSMAAVRRNGKPLAIRADHPLEGTFFLHVNGSPELLFTENDTNVEKLWGVPNASPYVKDGFDRYLIRGEREAVNPAETGTKAAVHERMTLGPGETRIVRLRLSRAEPSTKGGMHFDRIFAERQLEADQFYVTVIPEDLSADAKNVMRQALGGLLWSKQYYHYVVRDWLEGDPAQPKPPEARKSGRNADWAHLFNADVLSMPDKWEYPWFAAWDLAFHCIPLALVDADFAKEQLLLLMREWYMHPNGQIPAYEWAFGDVNPPVFAWAALRVYQIEKKRRGKGDAAFLRRVFHKLMLNFTWWVNRKDAEGRNVFQGGFLGLDNIGVFDRSAPLPTGGHIEQSDGTSWMAMFSLNMLRIAVELAKDDETYEDVASKFWEHFVHIARALNTLGLWDEKDGFFYDVLHCTGGERIAMRLRSMVGLIPLFAVESFEPETLKRLPAFTKRLEWFIDQRPDLTEGVACMRTPGQEGRRLFAVVSPARLRRVLQRMVDEEEFLSPYGIRAISAAYRDDPYVLEVSGIRNEVRYEPGESSSGLFGGNSNWRGPIWFPVNYLLIESLQKFHHYLGDSFTIEYPARSGQQAHLGEVAADISRRLSRIFLHDSEGRRPVFGANELLQRDPHFRDLIPFYEYFDGDNGRGVGATHQTGWTALVAKLLQQSHEMPTANSPVVDTAGRSTK